MARRFGSLFEGLPLRAPLVAAAALLLLAVPARAQTGVSDDRVSLPDGPGSLEGVGDNVEVDPNMALMRHSVAIKVPSGYAGMTPDLSLSYSSGSGTSVVGMGWSLPSPSIERLTSRGLPSYSLDDEFAVDGGEQLVRIPNTDPPVYRARFEKGFVRYTWKDAGSGQHGHWMAEYPDGRIGYFGAASDGLAVDSARSASAAGTFRYQLVEMKDRHGHAIRYSYFKPNVVLPAQSPALLSQIGWAFNAAGTPTYEATFAYEDRTDSASGLSDFTSDCAPGFEELLTKRLRRISVYVRTSSNPTTPTRIRYYDLAYENYASSGGFTRLVSVKQYGEDGTLFPAFESFQYSRALSGTCPAGQSCLQPFVKSLGSVHVDLKSRDATLLDINGDALPDLVDTSQDGGKHRIFLNVLRPGGTHYFDAPFESTSGTVSGHDLSAPVVQTMDVDGDGFTDLINTANGEVLLNRGTGDWAAKWNMWSSGTGGSPDLATDFDPQDGELNTVRFLDADNDRRIDLIRSEGAGAANVTTVFRNLGDGGFALLPGGMQLEAGFESDNLELNDMNGDGLLDPVQVLTSKVRYRLNLGRGQWSDWREVGGFSFTDVEAADAELEDINGDGLTDLVLVAGGTVRYWINRSGIAFESPRSLTSAEIPGLPSRSIDTTVLFADMNGNGSSDVVYVDATGEVTYVELFPVRHNLLNRIDNGLGRHITIDYGTSVEHQARDAEAGLSWKYRLPFPMAVVERQDEWNDVSQLHTVVTSSYRDGYYDGAEKQFRGFERVELSQPAQPTAEASLLVDTFNVGFDRSVSPEVPDPYLSGLALTSENRGAAGRSLRFSEKAYGDCTVAAVPAAGLRYPVRHICLLSERTEEREGKPEAQWVTTETHYQYDGYGNLTLERDLGVTKIGGVACPACDAGTPWGTPCGDSCIGDEDYTETTHARPEDNADRWILDKPVRVRNYTKADATGRPTAAYSEHKTYYDGPSFAGLAEGLVEKGSVTRVSYLADSTGRRVEQVRNALDAHGNVVEVLDALGVEGGNTHRRLYAFDELGLDVVRAEILLEDSTGPYRLRRDFQYHELWEGPIEATTWMLVRNGTPLGNRFSQYFGYDAFGRLSSSTHPNEAAGLASTTYTYELAAPISRIVSRSRSQVGGPMDLEAVRCLDGHGRIFQTRTKIATGKWLVDGFVRFNTQDEKVEYFQQYEAATGACDAEPPAGTLSVTIRRDALGRETAQVWPDPDPSDGVAAERRTEYLPLETVSRDEEDLRVGGPHFDTPTSTRLNGQEQVISQSRRLSASGAPLVDRFAYDELGELAGWIDPMGNTQVQKRDLLGQVIELEDPDRGRTVFEYDAQGNRTMERDARGVVSRYRYDGDNRLVERWIESDPNGTRIEHHYDFAGDCPAAKCANVGGRIARSTYPVAGSQGVDQYGYDLRGRPIYLGRRLDGHLFELGSEYDSSGKPIANTYPSGLRVAMVHDGTNRLTAVPGYVKSVTYDGRGQLSRFTLENGSITEFGFDSQLRLASLKVTAAQQVLDFGYARDGVGHLLRIDDRRADEGRPLGGAELTLDSLYRLTSARLDPGRAHEETLRFAYDSAENLLSKTSSKGAASRSHAGSYAYASAKPHAATQVGAIAGEYDAIGNLTRRGELELEWDLHGRLARAKRGGAEVASFGYESGGQRVLKREGGRVTYYPVPDFEVRDGVAVTYVRVGTQRVAEISEPAFAATMLSDLAPADGPDAALASAPDGEIRAADAWLARGVGSGVFTLATSRSVSSVESLLGASVERMLGGTGKHVRYLHGDHLGSIVAATDAEGALVEQASYDPFGLGRDAAPSALFHGFSGKERDASTGLVYFGARYYDPASGRWISPDPEFAVFDPKGLGSVPEATSPFAYNLNDPEDQIDEDGRLAHMVIGAIIGGSASMTVEIIKQVASGAWKNTTWKQKAKNVGTVALKTGLGAVTGALTGGLSAGFTIASTILDASIDSAHATAVNLAAERTRSQAFKMAKESFPEAGAREIAAAAAAITEAGVDGAINVGKAIVQLGMQDGTGSASSLGKAALKGYKAYKANKKLKAVMKRWGPFKGATYEGRKLRSPGMDQHKGKGGPKASKPSKGGGK